MLGHRESSVPFAYLDENQQPIGYSIDLCMKIVEAVEAELDQDIDVRFVPVNPKTRIALMANGTIDLECGSTTNNLTRQQQVEYLPTTFVTGTKILTRHRQRHFLGRRSRRHGHRAGPRHHQRTRHESRHR